MLPSFDKKKALRLLESDSPLHFHLSHFEPRDSQKQMMEDILDAYLLHKITLIEAGTGTGKSMAYLIPALLWASEKKERTLISTQTITLQEQLLFKDIPLLLKALNLSLKAVLVKGMNNYVCLRKLNEIAYELRTLEEKEREEILSIEKFIRNTSDGSKSSLSFVPSHAAWEKVSCESDTCNKQECPYYQECFFYKARKNAQDAQIIIANHHLLFADLSFRSEQDSFKDQGLLPFYSRVILDEAHHIEDVATEYFASKISQNSLMKTLGRIASDKGGKINLLKAKLIEHHNKASAKEISNLHSILNIDIPALRYDLQKQIHDTFSKLTEFTLSFGNKDEESSLNDSKLRLTKTHQEMNRWKEDVHPSLLQLIGILKRFSEVIFQLETNLKNLKDDKFNEQTKSVRFDILALATRLLNAAEILESFIADIALKTEVKWIESNAFKNFTNTLLVHAQLDIAKQLVDFLFKKFSTIVLCSATLTTNNKFDFIKKRLGLDSEAFDEDKINEKMYNSPFNYEKQALFVIPKDLPNPLQSNFLEQAVEKIWEAILASKGNAFVLFTSYSMLKQCYFKLISRLQEKKFHVLKQGDDNRKSLLNRFKSCDRSILFGTDSFWEGVDVVGEALRCVILVKLPFKVPTEPIIQARIEAIEEQGGDPFLEYSLPNAIVKFKQGFGRLIRNKNDRGCIVCLDSRLITKPYGKQFLSSLPSCQKIFIEGEHLQKEMTTFYKKTYSLVKKQ